MFKKRPLITFLIYLIGILFSVLPAQHDSCSSLKIAFAGDLMGHMPQVNAAYIANGDSFDFTPCYQFIKPYLAQTDIGVINFETTLAGKPYSGYPQFSAPEALAIAARDAGFNYFIMANNHCYDRGIKGFQRTMKTMDSLNIIHTGVFRNKAERDTSYPLIIRKNNISLALLNYTYSTNGIPVIAPTLVNEIDTNLIRADIDSCKKHHVDMIIACMHWGIEYSRTQNKEQEKLTQWLYKKGCHLVIGSHPHVIQPISYHYPNPYDSSEMKAVVYSVGNFLSNQRDRYRDGGLIVEAVIEKDSIARLKSFSYLPFWVLKGSLNGKYQYYAIPVDYYFANPSNIKLSEIDKIRLEEFAKETQIHMGKATRVDFFLNMKKESEKIVE